MGDFRFTIIKRDTTQVPIKQPPGWDKVVSSLTRDLDWHGIFFARSGQDAFEFYGIAHDLLKDEYDLYGSQGKMFLKIEERCGYEWEVYDTAKFLFLKYKHFCDNGCYVRIPLESATEVMQIRNRVNQKVDLETLLAFDGVTTLPPYAALPFDLSLPSKGIYIKSQALTEAPSVEEFEGGLQPVYHPNPVPGYPDWNLTYFAIEFGLKDKVLSEVGSFLMFETHLMSLTSQNNSGYTRIFRQLNPFPPPPRNLSYGIGVWPLNLSPIENFTEDSNNYNDIKNPVQFDIRIKGTLEIMECWLLAASIALLRLPDNGDPDNGTEIEHYEIMGDFTVWYQYGSTQPYAAPPNSGNLPFDFIYQADRVLEKGDRYYLAMFGTERKQQDNIDAINAGAKAMKLTLDVESHVVISDLSSTKVTVSKAFAVNEAISRVAEVITNNEVLAYSEYYGRTDSEPYSHATDGCGGLKVILDGYRVRRQENKIPDKPVKFVQSLQDLFEGLNPVDNIGMGIEPDPMRLDKNRLRVEPWRYFYDNTVIMSCTGINKLTREVFEKDICSTYTFGYNRWEAEEYNGLDEFLTKRIYRTTLDEAKNDFTKISKMIASGYALEITRRKGSADSKDWRYDKETFLICVSRDRSFQADFYAGVEGVSRDRIVFQYFGVDTSMFLVGSLTVAGSQFNDGTRTVFVVSIVNDGAGMNTITIEFTGTGTVEEIAAAGITFPGIVFPAGLFVELGNITAPANIVDPKTIYNWRISPVRNAMRWLNKLLVSYRNFDPAAKLIFTDGDANYYAEGEMTSTDCKLENGVIAENVELSLAIYADPADAEPFLLAERVTYEYPMNSAEYNLLKANPRGKIYFESDCDSGHGWIADIKHVPDDGKATFVLIPEKV